MSTAVLDQRPPRAYLVHLKSNTELAFQFNPLEVGEAVEVAWNRLKILGQSHEEMQYQRTGNLRIEFELAYDALLVGGGSYDTRYARQWLLACCYPMRGAQDVRSGAPSRLLFVWPRMWSIVCRLLGVKFSHKRFNLSGISTMFTAALQLEVDSMKRIDFETILYDGDTRRHDKSAEG